MKYLISLEGEYLHIVNDEEELQKFLIDYAEAEKLRGVKDMDKWLEDMQNHGFTHHFTTYPEVILPLDETNIKILKKAIDK